MTRYITDDLENSLDDSEYSEEVLIKTKYCNNVFFKEPVLIIADWNDLWLLIELLVNWDSC